MTDETTLAPWWEAHGYLRGREIGGGIWICLARMLFTYRVMLCTPLGVIEFYCYEDPALAEVAYAVWDGGKENPVFGWTRHHV